MNVLYKFEIFNPLKFIELGKKKPKKYYLTNQIFYSGIHFAIRMKIVEYVKFYIGSLLHNVEPLPRIAIYLDFYGKIKDLDNKAFFWTKIIQDWLTNNGKLKDDDVKWIKELHYRYIDGSDCDRMDITFVEA